MQYLMLIYQDGMKEASAEEQAAVGKGYGELNAFLAQSGALRGTATWPAGITTIRSRQGKTLATDGPYAESREAVAGFFSSMCRTSTPLSRLRSAYLAPATVALRSAP